MLKASYYKHMMGRLAQQFNNVMVVAESIKQGVKSGRISAPVKKKGFEGKIRRSTILKVATRVGKTNSKTTTLHLKLPTSTPYFLLENLSPKTFKPKTKLKIFQRKITNETKNNYPHYCCL